jgi:glucose/arabinose dehydrogenase
MAIIQRRGGEGAGPRRSAASIACVMSVLACAAPAGGAPPSADSPRLVRMAEVMSPTYVTAPPGDRHRLFVTEKTGAVRVIRDGKLLAEPFLDLSEAVVTESEQGLASIAFAPDYAASGRFYVFYTAPRPGDSLGAIITVSEFRRSASSPDLADAASERVLLTIDHPGSAQHNGGQLQFGPDRLLYISTGDGNHGAVVDPPNNARNLGVLLGKVLRIDPRQQGDAPYAVPPGNPFVDRPGARGEIIHFGLRNPWRFSFDRGTGDMLIGDVGQARWEEVDYLPAGHALGADFGWRCLEGRDHTSGLEPPCNPGSTYRPPILVYPHSPDLCAITGGLVVRDPALPSLYGRYVYGDFCAGELRSLVPAAPAALDDAGTGLMAERIDTFGQDACGHVFAASKQGDVYRIASPLSRPCWRVGRTEPPTVTLGVRGRQRLGPRLRVHVRCDKRCGVALTGRIAFPQAGLRHRLVALSRTAAAGVGMRLRPALPREARRAARAALERGEVVRAVLRLRVQDTAGNQVARRVRVRLTG